MELSESAKTKRKEIIGQLSEFPAIPTAALQAQKLLNAAQVDFDKLARIIRNDQALTANLLRLANTISYGGRQRIETVGQAIVRLGTRHVSQMVVGLAASSLMQQRLEGYDMGPKDLWKHALAVAIGASELTKNLEMDDPDLAFTGGILHDVGKVALANFVHAKADTIEKIAFDKNVSFHVAERVILGVDHAEVGAMLMDDWGLTEHLVNVIRWHHEPNKCSENCTLVDVVHISNAVTMQAGIGTGIDGLHYKLYPEAVDRLEVPEDILEGLSLEIEGRLEQLSDAFD